MADRPRIAVFDSGIGGLSVLQALRLALPQANFSYLADSAWAPYGERSPEAVLGRCLQLAALLLRQRRFDALVVACNTATALAIEGLRQHHPGLAVVGIEPALKPAAERSQSRHIGVLATRGTLQSPRFLALQSRILAQHPGLQISLRACDGLADAIERADEQGVQALAQTHLRALRGQSPGGPNIDTLVLGCTHYPLALSALKNAWAESAPAPDSAAQAPKWLEPGPAVARQTRAVLGLDVGAKANNADFAADTQDGVAKAKPALTRLLSTAKPHRLNAAALHWLGLSAKARWVPV